MDGDIDGQDIRLLTRANAVFLYNRCFWKPLGVKPAASGADRRDGL
jgi:hypothetical protein